ncbi:MAG: phospholipase D family protein [Chitinophagaceae bacterium]|nr:phospholipase D family protein [Chitinophagaceae bacterium]
MAEFLTTRGTSHHIESIIMDARMKVVLVSPFLQLSKTLYERLKDATKRGVVIVIIYGKDDLKPNEKNSLAELKNLELYFHENLHAKCYFNETKMVITSMNMYQFSENNNREFGILIDLKTEPDLYKKAENEVKSILEHSDNQKIHKQERNYFKEKINNTDPGGFKKVPQIPKMGYCLRCEGRINFDPFKPYCRECFSTWAQFENPYYNESVCHCCGEYTDNINMAKPLCAKCASKIQAN